MDIGNLNSRLYGISYSPKMKENDSKGVESKPEQDNSQVAQPRPKKITASITDMVAEMNKGLVKGADTQQPRGNEDDLSILVNNYKQKKFACLSNKLKPEDLLEKANEFLETVNDIIALYESGAISTDAADIDIDALLEYLHKEQEFWEDTIRGFKDGTETPRTAEEPDGGRGLADTDGDLRANGVTTAETGYTYDNLTNINDRLWNKVDELLTRYNIEHDMAQLNQIGDNSPNNEELTEPLVQLCDLISDVEAEELAELVNEFLVILNSLHDADHGDYSKIKHQVQFGIIACILDPKGLH